MSIRVVILDDHPLIVNGLENIIKKYDDIELIGTYLNGDDLLKDLSKKKPDVAILDINMPDKSGDEIAKIIFHEYPKIVMLALTNLDNIYYIKSMLQQGVSGYILKSTKEETLIQAIRKVNRGEQFLDSTIKDRLQHDKISIARQTAHGTILTRREKEVLKLIAENYTSQEIADKLFLSKRTIDSHRLNLLLKLEVKNTAALIKKCIDMGLL
ncbi:MAG TPA: response regulator transcription factor [Flavipsychrobacter sp.]|nr:response regulator transcription factor [Flavipsychrobacter sp.]